MQTRILLQLSLALLSTNGYAQLVNKSSALAKFADKLHGHWKLTELNAGGKVVNLQ